MVVVTESVSAALKESPVKEVHSQNNGAMGIVQLELADGRFVMFSGAGLVVAVIG